MRRPDRARNIALGCAAVGAASFVTALALPSNTLSAGVHKLMVVGGMTVAVLCGIIALPFIWDARGYRKLMAGKGLITQWIVDSATWEAFLAYQAQLEPLNPTYPGWHHFRKNVGSEGVEIIIGEKSMILDGDYQRLPTKRNDYHFEELSLQPGPPMFVNMHMRHDYYSKGRGMQHLRYSLRFPVPDDAVEEARLAISQLGQAYTAVNRRSLAEMNPLLFYRVCLVLTIACAISFAVGMSMAGKPQMMNQTAAMVLAVVGAVLGLGALVGTIIGWKMSRERHAR